MTTAWTFVIVAMCLSIAVLTLVAMGLINRTVPLLENLEALVAPSSMGSYVERIPGFRAESVDGTLFEYDPDTAPTTLFVFIEPGCRPCKALLTDLRNSPLEALRLPLVVVTDDSEQGRAALPKASSVVGLVQQHRRLASLFGSLAAPQAYALLPGGRVIERLVPATFADLEGMAARAREEAMPLVAVPAT